MHAWWRDAVVYEIYPRSFADDDGDGTGDLPGIVHRLPYLRRLGVDAIWVTPFYVSPLRDGGYDVADYDRPDPRFGTLADAEQLIAAAHGLGLRVLFDVVPNHTSSEHRWFREALASPPGEGAWRRYHCVRGRGDGGVEPPNDWRSVFGGRAWTPVGDGTGWWYLHLFDPSQPDLNWNDPDVWAEHERVLRFWFDRGVDGFRIDVAHGLVKAPGYPDAGLGGRDWQSVTDRRATGAWDQPGVHDIYRRWRTIADGYDPPRVFCGEVQLSDPVAQAAYLRPDELQTAFNFPFLKAPWDAHGLRRVIDDTLAAAQAVGAPATWVLSNHDVERQASRLGPERARAATLLMLGLPGSAYLYQGEELGLPEAELPAAARQDPVFLRSGGAVRGRDGCRVPLPWSRSAPDRSWLPWPAEWPELSVEAQEDDPSSTLTFYRRALELRRAELLGQGELQWRDVGDTVLCAQRGDVVVWVNLGPDAIELAGDVLLASSPVTDGTLPADTAAYVRA
jgi:alpha-glucosidase